MTIRCAACSCLSSLVGSFYMAIHEMVGSGGAFSLEPDARHHLRHPRTHQRRRQSRGRDAFSRP